MAGRIGLVVLRQNLGLLLLLMYYSSVWTISQEELGVELKASLASYTHLTKTQCIRKGFMVQV